MAKARKSNGHSNGERYPTLGGKLEYADLRELEDIIENRALRPRFDGRFPNRNTQ